MTSREEIAFTDVQMFFDNPILGVGMGQSTVVRGEKYGLWMPPHTEFSRLLSEHGLMGCVGIVMLLFMGWTNFRRARSLKQRALATSMMCFSMLFMSVSAMRLVLPSFTFGLAALVLIPDQMSGRLKKRPEPAVVPA